MAILAMGDCFKAVPGIHGVVLVAVSSPSWRIRQKLLFNEYNALQVAHRFGVMALSVDTAMVEGHLLRGRQRDRICRRR